MADAKELQREYARRYREKFPERHRAAVRRHREKNLDRERVRVKLSVRKWRAENPEKEAASTKAWRDANPGYGGKRYRSDLQFRLRQVCRSRIQDALKESRKTGSTLELLGCSIHELKQHLEQQFQPGMMWENYGLHGWHIDHRKALANFDLTDPVQLKKACHFSNLQPLWAKDNLSKGSR